MSGSNQIGLAVMMLANRTLQFWGVFLITNLQIKVHTLSAFPCIFSESTVWAEISCISETQYCVGIDILYISDSVLCGRRYLVYLTLSTVCA